MRTTTTSEPDRDSTGGTILAFPRERARPPHPQAFDFFGQAEIIPLVVVNIYREVKPEVPVVPALQPQEVHQLVKVLHLCLPPLRDAGRRVKTHRQWKDLQALYSHVAIALLYLTRGREVLPPFRQSYRRPGRSNPALAYIPQLVSGKEAAYHTCLTFAHLYMGQAREFAERDPLLLERLKLAYALADRMLLAAAREFLPTAHG